MLDQQGRDHARGLHGCRLTIMDAPAPQAPEPVAATVATTVSRGGRGGSGGGPGGPGGRGRGRVPARAGRAGRVGPVRVPQAVPAAVVAAVPAVSAVPRRRPWRFRQFRRFRRGGRGGSGSFGGSGGGGRGGSGSFAVPAVPAAPVVVRARWFGGSRPGGQGGQGGSRPGGQDGQGGSRTGGQGGQGGAGRGPRPVVPAARVAARVLRAATAVPATAADPLRRPVVVTDAFPEARKAPQAARGRRAGLSRAQVKVQFGEYGLKSIDAGWITNRQIEAARIAMTRKIRRGGKVWINIYPDKPSPRSRPRPHGLRKGSPRAGSPWSSRAE